MNQQTPPPRSAIAGPDDTGKTCPYCRFPVKEQTAVTVCGACSSVHHDDCWADNGGCSVVGCVSGPNAEVPTNVAPPIAAPAAGPVPTIIQDPIPPGVPQTGATTPMYPGPPADAKQSPPPTGPIAWQPAPQLPAKRSPGLAISVLVLALAVAGTGAVVAISSQNKHTPVAAADTSSSTNTNASGDGVGTSSSSDSTGPDPASTSSNDSTTTDSGVAMDGALPADSKRTMTSDIKDLLLTWHEDVVSGDYHGAWVLLSSRKRAQSLRKFGYAGWKSNQASLSPYLNPSGIRVRIVDTDNTTGEATVDVKGMTWSQPDASCSEWSGITWVKYEHGAWKYDPGYSTTHAREAEWKNRFPILLGGRC